MIHKKSIITIFAAILFGFTANSQSVDITPEYTSGTCSDFTVTFQCNSSSVATSFDFNGGSLPSGWSTSPYTISSTYCAGKNSPDNSPYFWATTLASSGTYSGKRFVQTKSVNVSTGGYINFYIRYASDDGTGCEDPDLPDEEVILSYSTDGGSNWTTIYDGWDTDGSKSAAWYNWYWNEFTVPAGAQTANTIFRWYQPSNSSSTNDNWGLEDISIGTNIVPVSYKWFVNSVQVSTTEDINYTFSSAGTYTIKLEVLFSDGITRSSTISYEVLSNQNPTINALSDITVPMNGGQQGINLSGITDGDCVSQNLTLSTLSANTSIIPNPTYSYTSPNSTGMLYFTPPADEVGGVRLYVTVNDDGANAYGAGLSTTRDFYVTINDVPTNPGAFIQPAGDKLNIDYDYDIEWGASTDRTASVSYYLEYMLNGGSWTTIGSGLSPTTYSSWGGHKNVSLVGRTVQFRVRSYDGTYFSGYTYSSSYEIIDNTPPVANNDSYKRFYTDTGVSFSIPAAGVLSNDTDVDNDVLSIGTPRPASNVTRGSLTYSIDESSFIYTPDNGTKDVNDSFTYYAYDGTVNSNSTATVTIEILTPRFTNANGTGLFSDPLNWNCGYVPNVESLNIIIAAGTELQVNQNYTCKTLKFEAGASFKCINGNKLTITGNVLNRNGDVAIEISSSLEVNSSIRINNE